MATSYIKVPGEGAQAPMQREQGYTWVEIQQGNASSLSSYLQHFGRPRFVRSRTILSQSIRRQLIIMPG